MTDTEKEQTTPAKVVAVRFEPLGKLYYFDSSAVPDVVPGDYVMVTTTRGQEMARVVSTVPDPGAAPERGWKPVERLATPQELVLRRMWEEREAEALVECRTRAAALGMQALKIARASYSMDGSSLTFYYASEEEVKVDLKPLRQALRNVFRRTRIEFRAFGPRDLAKVWRGLGACGIEQRCCARFLCEFSPISIKMAKAQGISLNPQEITGMCGRLRCCLIYEYEQYAEARSHMPKLKKRVRTPQGEGRVVDVLAMKQTVVVQFEDGKHAEFRLDELELVEGAQAPSAKGKQARSDDEDDSNANEAPED